MLSRFDSLIDLLKAFPTEQSCLDHVRAIRWREGKDCPYCGGTRIYHLNDKRDFQCGKCRSQFSIKVGTIFRDTKLPLRKWFMVIQLITNYPKGIASTRSPRTWASRRRRHGLSAPHPSCNTYPFIQYAAPRRSSPRSFRISASLPLKNRFVRRGRTLIVTDAHVAHAAMPTAVPHEMINL